MDSEICTSAIGPVGLLNSCRRAVSASAPPSASCALAPRVPTAQSVTIVRCHEGRGMAAPTAQMAGRESPLRPTRTCARKRRASRPDQPGTS